MASDKKIRGFYWRFYRYLKALPPRLKFATTDCDGDCPIAQFFKSLGRSEVSVTREQLSYVSRDGTDHYAKTPKWAANFITELDTPKRRVSANECLEVLTGQSSLYHRENGI